MSPKHRTQSHPRVELEVTPSWWFPVPSRLDPELWARLVTQSLLLATKEFDTCELRVSPERLAVVVQPPFDATFGSISQKAADLIEKLEALVNRPG